MWFQNLDGRLVNIDAIVAVEIVAEDDDAATLEVTLAAPVNGSHTLGISGTMGRRVLLAIRRGTTTDGTGRILTG